MKSEKAEVLRDEVQSHEMFLFGRTTRRGASIQMKVCFNKSE